jgi:DNA invertase Pin-like site-specific DNA recombinase
MTVYGYLRVSTGMQDVENQKVGVVLESKKRNIEIDEYITDNGVSGGVEPEKRQLGHLLKKLKDGDTLIASEISRLGRSLFMVMRILEYCMKNGVMLYTHKDNYELGDNIQSKVLAFAFGLAAEIERKMISERTKEALQRKKADGVILGRRLGSKSSFYKLDKHKQKIEHLFYTKKMSLTKIAKRLHVHRGTVSDHLKRWKEDYLTIN